MNHKRDKKTTWILAAFFAALMVAPAQAGWFDFWNGQPTKPGSEYYEVGQITLAKSGGGPAYFTNLKGRFIEVRARKDDQGELRVTVWRLYIPPNYIAETLEERQFFHRVKKEIVGIIPNSVKYGEYIALSGALGERAWKAAKIVEREQRKSHRTSE